MNQTALELETLPGSLLDHHAWPLLLPYVVAEMDGPKRFRLELKAPPRGLLLGMLSMQVRCCACGKTINPVRHRKLPGNKRGEFNGHGLFIAVACPLAVNVGCSRGHDARDAYQDIKAEVDAFAGALASATERLNR